MKNGNAKIIIRLMSDGKPRTVTDLMAETGLTREQVGSAIGNSIKCLDRQPVTYTINDVGRARANHRREPVPKPPKPPTINKSGKVRKPRVIEARRTPIDGLVQRSIRKNPNSVFALGAMA